MVTLKDLRDMRKNDEEANGENASECIESSDNLEKDNDYLAMMLLCFIWMQEHENEKLWENFQDDIKHNSRFFPKSELLEKVDNVSVYASVELCTGTILYRAREYKNNDYLKNKEVVMIYEKLNELFPNMKLQLEDVKSDSAMNIISLALGGDVSKMENCVRILWKQK